MEFKVRGNVVLFQALEVKKASKLILGKDDKEYKYVVSYVGDVEDINVGDEIVLRSIQGIDTVDINKEVHLVTAPHNVLMIVTGNTVETYTAEESFERGKEAFTLSQSNTPNLQLNTNTSDIIIPPR